MCSPLLDAGMNPEQVHCIIRECSPHLTGAGLTRNWRTASCGSKGIPRIRRSGGDPEQPLDRQKIRCSPHLKERG